MTPTAHPLARHLSGACKPDGCQCKAHEQQQPPKRTDLALCAADLATDVTAVVSCAAERLGIHIDNGDTYLTIGHTGSHGTTLLRIATHDARARDAALRLYTLAAEGLGHGAPGAVELNVRPLNGGEWLVTGGTYTDAEGSQVTV